MDSKNIKTSLAFFVIIATFGMATAFTTVQRGTAALSDAANFTNIISPLLGNPYFAEQVFAEDCHVSQAFLIRDGLLVLAIRLSSRR